MKKQFHLLAIALVGMVALLACGLTDQLVANTVGGAKGNTVPNLWKDVPPIAGAQKQTLDMPITVQLGIQALIKTSAASQGGNIDSFDWIAYQTNQTPQQITAFYTNDRMKAAGWSLQKKDEPGCVSGGDAIGIGGAFCIFAKGGLTPNDKGSIIFIVPVQQDTSKPTQVYYVRLEGISDNTTPTKSK